VGERLGQHIKDKTGFDTRVTVLGHIQRGGTPTAHDRVLSTRFGANAARLVEKGRFGHMVALRGNEIVDVPLADAVAELKTVPDAVFRIAEPFFG
jgi:6-phosphofructokinase 1